MGALQGLIPERVAAIGSLSKRLAPGVALGWILSPSWLTGALTYEKGAGGASLPAIEQAALADFLARGALERHLRRARLTLRERRDALLRALARELPQARVMGIPAGVFTLAVLPAGRGRGSGGEPGHRPGAAGGGAADRPIDRPWPPRPGARLRQQLT